MAQVTVELRHLLKTDFELFDFDYQFDDIKFKKQLEQHIIDYYYDYEIGQETPEMFKRKFITRWKRIIPYYNELYNTTLLEYNPLTNYTMSEAFEQLSSSTSSQSARGTTTNEDQNIISSEDSSNTKNSDYPQQSIAIGNYLSGESLTDNLSNTTTNTSSTTTNSDSSDSTNNSNSSYEKTIEGITGVTYQELIKQQRESILRIPDMVVREMKPCFVLVY